MWFPPTTEFSETNIKYPRFLLHKKWSFGKVLQILWIDVKGNLLLPMIVQLLVHRDDVEVNIQGKEMLILYNYEHNLELYRKMGINTLSYILEWPSK